MLPTNPKQEAGKDARFYAAVPFRSATDRRLSMNDLRILTLICGYLRKDNQIVWPHQQSMADALGVVHTLVYRHVKRLEAFGYLVALAPKVKLKMVAVYGVVFDPDRPPTRRDLHKIEADVQQDGPGIEQLLKKEAITQPISRPAVKTTPTQLVIVWRGLCFDYQPNELEQRHWQELATLGATPEHLAAWYQPGRNLIGYYMSQARSCLGAG